MHINVSSPIALVLVLLTLIAGVQFLRGRWLNLIAGYNTMSSEEKSKANGKFAGKVLGVLLLVSSVIIGTAAVFPKASTVCFVLQVTAVIIAIVYVNTSKERNNR